MTVLVDRTGSGSTSRSSRPRACFAEPRRASDRVFVGNNDFNGRGGPDRDGRRLARRRRRHATAAGELPRAAHRARVQPAARTCRRSGRRSTSTAPSTSRTSAGGAAGTPMSSSYETTTGRRAVRSSPLSSTPVTRWRGSASRRDSTCRSRTSRRWAWSGWSSSDLVDRGRSARTAPGLGRVGRSARRHDEPDASRAALDRPRRRRGRRDLRTVANAKAPVARGEQPRPRRVPLPASQRHRTQPALGDAGRADEQRLRLVQHDGPRDRSGQRAAAAVPSLPRRLHGHEVAVGKDFCGIFSTSNVPNNANFPIGVTYQRNANFATHTLFARDGVTVVQPSIDPFFFSLDGARGRRRLLRRATGPTARRAFDLGVEPSSEPVFYNRSDVWNRRDERARRPSMRATGR